MPDISSDKQTATTYPPKSLYELWCEEAEERNSTISQYILRMVEAGRKEIELDELATDSIQELRQQRADLQQELEHHRRRVKNLEQQLQHTAQVEILEYLEENPGATTPEIIQHIADTVPARVASHLDILEGDALQKRDDGYYLNAEDADSALKTTSSEVPKQTAGDF